MKKLLALCLVLSSSLALANEELTKKLDALFDLRIKINEDYRDQFAEEATELENKEAREFLEKSEKENGQVWVDFLKRMKTNPDLKARIQLLRLEIVGEINNGYYDLEFAEGVKDQFKARGVITKWNKHLKELEAAEALLEKSAKSEKKE